MSSPRWHWSPYSGTQYLLQSETHNIPCHVLQTRSLHFPQCSAGRPLHCRRSSCLRTIFENPIGSWNLPETKHVGLPILIKALFHFRLYPCKHFKVSPGGLHFNQLKSIWLCLFSAKFQNIKRPFHVLSNTAVKPTWQVSFVVSVLRFSSCLKSMFK